jgi:peptidoglycan hydrolase-like protein with peptidoglycan-binding domain
MYNKIFTTAELISEMKKFNWTRIPKELHLHHTWKPTHKSFNLAVSNYGLAKAYAVLQDSMRNYHMNTNGWADIAQHLTLMPDGNWVVGRDWNLSPVSISGRNSLGFAVEIVGNFDTESEGEYNSLGYNKLEGEQLKSIQIFTQFFLSYHSADFVFHRDYSTKTCPGTSVQKVGILKKEFSLEEKVEILWDEIFGIEEKDDFMLLQKGMKGEKIKELQTLLNKHGAKLAIDGSFGSLTEKAVNEFKAEYKLAQNGIVDWYVWSLLEKDPAPEKEVFVGLKIGDKGDRVREWQRLMNLKMGEKLNVDGSYGALTRAATIRTQKTLGIPQTGVVNENTWDRTSEYNKKTSEDGTQIDEVGGDVDFINFNPMVQLNKQFGYYTKFGQTKVVQSALNIIGKSNGSDYALVEDGKFGKNTESALNSYKKIKGLPQNGLVDSVCWKHIHYDLEKAQQDNDFKINWYDNQTKILRVKLSDINFKTVKAVKSVDSLINMMNTIDEEIIVACSGGLFGMANGVTLSSLIVDGKIETMGVYSRWAISQDKDGEIKLRGLNWEKQIGNIDNIVSAIGACPSLIVGGKENVDLTGIQNEPSYINNNHPRLCVGLDDAYFYIVISHGRASSKGYYGENVRDMVKIGLSIGLKDMIMLDGGNSIQVRAGSKNSFKRLDDNSSNRLIDNAIILTRKL